MRRMRTALAATAAIAVALTPAACGSDQRPGTTASCGVISDASGSATELFERSRSAIERFVVEHRCETVQIVAITANSVGDSCTAPDLDLAGDMRTNPDNVEAWDREFAEEQVPVVSDAARELAQCVAQRNTGNGSDVFGALVELDNLADPTAVLLVSDLVHNTGVDLATAPIATPEERGRLRDQVVGKGLVPSMAGWSVEIVGAAYGTTALGPERSAQLQQFFRELVQAQGGSVRMSST